MLTRMFNFTAPIHERKRKIVVLAILTFLALC